MDGRHGDTSSNGCRNAEHSQQAFRTWGYTFWSTLQGVMAFVQFRAAGCFDGHRAARPQGLKDALMAAGCFDGFYSIREVEDALMASLKANPPDSHKIQTFFIRIRSAAAEMKTESSELDDSADCDECSKEECLEETCSEEECLEAAMLVDEEWQHAWEKVVAPLQPDSASQLRDFYNSLLKRDNSHE